MLWLYQLWYVRTVRTFSLLGEEREGVSLSLSLCMVYAQQLLLSYRTHREYNYKYTKRK